jgi:hypothetical protein
MMSVEQLPPIVGGLKGVQYLVDFPSSPTALAEITKDCATSRRRPADAESMAIAFGA